jgi:tryptophan-rich sensory protein
MRGLTGCQGITGPTDTGYARIILKGDSVFYSGEDENYRAAPRAQFYVLLGFLVLCLAVAASAGWLTAGATMIWYASLAHPPLSPPNWLFGPVWAVMYVSMAVAAWMIWRDSTVPRRRRNALTLWGVQLAVNATWTPVFFGLHLVLAGVAVMAALLASVALTARQFALLDRKAGLLMTPYVLWVGFATYLNAGFWWLNGG